LSVSSDERFREMFYEEARELLIGLEEGLMDLERRQSDRAHLDRTFRAAHSLKGAAGMVGLAAVAEFTHGIEAVLDKIRGGTLAVDSDIITTLLEARDHLAMMVESEAVKSPIPPSGDLSQRLNLLLGGRGSAGAGGGRSDRAGVSSEEQASSEPKFEPERQPKPKRKRAPRKTKQMAADDAVIAGRSEPAEAESELPVYQITLVPGPDVLRRGVNPLGVLDELRDLGETTITTDPDLVPPLEQLDPERCYLNWTIQVKTAATLERISEAFLFFAEDSALSIARLMPDGTLVPVHLATAPAGDAGLAPPPIGFETPALSAGSAPLPEVAHPAQPTAAKPARGAKRDKSGAPPRSQASQPAGAAPGRGAIGNGSPIAAPFQMSPPAAVVPQASAAPAAQGPLAAPSPSLPRLHARIRVDAGQLDDLVGLAGELVVVTDNLLGLREIPGVERWTHAIEALERVSREIRDTTLDLRMVPVDELFSRFPRVVRDLADRSGKEIELRIVGQDTRLDRTIVERLSDPMIHLIRNAVDHALEQPQERVGKGKPRVGRITLSAGHEGDRVAIRVEDDGRGLDCEKIVRKGISLGMVPTGTPADDPRVVSLIFEPGFSTRDTISELSGRGVGLDVVRDAVRALRGSVAVESTPGKGTAFIFRLPLTLALIDGLLVETGGGRYVVPMAQVEECLELDRMGMALSRERNCVSVRGDLVPTVSLRNLFRADGLAPERQELLLTRHGGQRVGVAVDRLVGRVQAVIQSLGENMHGLNRFSGATILGDGTVSLILDLSAVVSESRFAEQRTRT
jgi:two-component system, chemotaxis family, sensor kinase CheA